MPFPNFFRAAAYLTPALASAAEIISNTTASISHQITMIASDQFKDTNSIKSSDNSNAWEAAFIIFFLGCFCYVLNACSRSSIVEENDLCCSRRTYIV